MVMVVDTVNIGIGRWLFWPHNLRAIKIKYPVGGIFILVGAGDSLARHISYAGCGQTVTICLRYACQIYLFSDHTNRVCMVHIHNLRPAKHKPTVSVGLCFGGCGCCLDTQ